MDQIDKCANAQCPIARNGKCLEGLAKEVCPHYGKEPDESDIAAVEDASEETTPAVPSVVEGKLAPAELLGQPQADSHYCARKTFCIALVGPNEAGKTSLFASFYDMFQEGPFAGYACKWCDTLHGFEIACHHSRLASQREVPYTERTKLRAGLRYYQMTLRGHGNDLNLLLADRAGESYNDAASVSSKAAGFEELRRADTIAVLLDGEKLLHDKFRHSAKANLEMTLQGIVDSGVLGPIRRLAIVLTKLDLVLSSDRAQSATTEFDVYAEKLRTRFAAHFGVVRSFRISSSPSAQGHVQRGHGLQELFEFWIDPVPPLSAQKGMDSSDRLFQHTRELA